MDNEDRRLTVNGVTALAATLVIGVSAWFLVPQMQHAKAAGPLFLTVSWVSVLGGALAGLAAYGVSAALERRWLTWKAVAFVASLMATVLVVNISLAGWVHLFDGLSKTAALLPHGRAGGVETTTFESYRSAIAKDRDAYRNELGALEYPRFLAPAVLATPDGREYAHSNIILARALVAKYQSLYMVRMVDLKDAYAKGKGGGTAERLEKTMAPEYAARLEWWKITDRIMAEQQAMIDDLNLSNGRLKAQGNAILFRSKSDLETYNAHVAALNALQEQAHTLDLKIAHESDKADEAMFNVRAGGVQ